MFTKDKKRAGEKKPAPQKNPSQAAERRRKPAEAPVNPAEGHPRRKPAGMPDRPKEPQKRRPADVQGKPVPEGSGRNRKEAPGRSAENMRKKTAEERKTAPAGRPRKRPSQAPGTAAVSQRRRPAENGKRPVREPVRPPKKENLSVEPKKSEKESLPLNQGPAEEQVFKIEQAPRETPVTSRTAKRQAPGKKTTRKSGKREPPQGTSYHRSAPKQKKTLLDYFRQKTLNPYITPEEQAAAAQKRRDARQEKKKKLQKLAAKFDAPAIVYTDPKPFNRNRLLIHLISVLAVASAFVLGLSIFFKVETITVSGADTYSPYKIEEASGIHKGDYLLTFGRARACGQITAKLPYIKSVRIGIKLPNTVNIDVKEAAVAYSIRSGDGDWWLITSEGKVVKQIPGTTSGGYTTVLGVQIDKPVAGQEAVALEAVPEETKEGEAPKEEKKDKDGNSLLEPPVTVSATMRLKSALRILSALEENDIVGDAATVNVENLEKIELWYGQKYQVNLGSTEQLEYKVACMYDAILQMSEYQNGMLDVSFTKKKDQVIYTPFI